MFDHNNVTSFCLTLNFNHSLLTQHFFQYDKSYIKMIQTVKQEE